MKGTSRYSRQTNLKSFGAGSQIKLQQSKVLVVGLGGLGIPVAQYLNAMGVGTLGLVENDAIELHNLQRQVLYTEDMVGKSKLEAGVAYLQKQNSDTKLKPFDTYLNRDNALDIIKGFDVVVDATDNFATRYLVNDACVLLKKPFVYGALHDFEGQVSVFNYNDGPTYRCLFPDMPEADEIPNCDINGVLGVLPGIIGTLQALEVVKVITGVGDVLSGKLLLYDGLTQSTHKMAFQSRPENKAIAELQKDYGFSGCTSHNNVPNEQFEKLFSDGNIQLIDVRSPKEYESFHLQNSRNIPLPEFKERLDELDHSQAIYLICKSGKRSGIASELLQKQYPNSNSYTVLGGIDKMAHLCH